MNSRTTQQYFFSSIAQWLLAPFWKANRFVWIASVLFAVATFGLGVWQLYTYAYTGFDLAIFDQVLFNSAQGNLFAYSFDTHTYLADHRAWLLLLLAPLYWLVEHPLVLVAVQAIVVGLGAVATFYAVRVVLESDYMPQDFSGSDRQKELIASAVAWLYVLQPIVQHMVLFEFHLLPLTMPIVFVLIAAVVQQQYSRVWLYSAVLLLVRDDLGLLVAGVGVFLVVGAVLARAQRMQAVAHGMSLILVGFGYLAAMAMLGAAFVPTGTTKFFVFYEWLGNSPTEAIVFMATHPLQTVLGALSGDHALTALVLLALFAVLPLLRMRWLIPAAAVLAPYFLASEDILFSVLTSHYAAPALPWLMVAAVISVAHVYVRLAGMQWKRVPIEPTVLFVSGLVAIAIMQIVILSPYHTLQLHAQQINAERIADYDFIVDSITQSDTTIDGGARVLSTAGLYPHISHRSGLYAVQHLLSGKQHFSHEEYKVPEQVDWVVLEKQVLLTASQLYTPTERSGSDDRFAQVIEQNQLQLFYNSPHLLVYAHESVAGWNHQSERIQPLSLFDVDGEQLQADSQQVGSITVWEPQVRADMVRIPMQQLLAQGAGAIDQDIHAAIEWLDEHGNTIAQEIVHIGGIQPSATWEEGDTFMAHLPVKAPATANSAHITVGVLTSTPRSSSIFNATDWSIVDGAQWNAIELQ